MVLMSTTFVDFLFSNLLLQHPDFGAFKDFIIQKSSENLHFALRVNLFHFMFLFSVLKFKITHFMQIYLLIRANKDSRKPPKKKKLIPKPLIKWRMLCDELMDEIRNVVTLPFESQDLNPFEFFDVREIIQ